MPNSSVLNDDRVGELPLSNDLSTAAKKTRILSGLKSATLVSLGQLADDGCTTTITTPELVVKKKGKIILRGKRNYHDGLYDIPIYKTKIAPDNYIIPTLKYIPTKSTSCDTDFPPPKTNNKHKMVLIRNPYDVNIISNKCMQSVLQTTMHKDHKINVILRKQQKSADLAEFLHGCCCSPVSSTFITAIKNNHFLTWPGLTAQLIAKHLPRNRATAKGHIHQEAQGLQSTKKIDNDSYIKTIRNNISRLTRGNKGVNIKQLLEEDMEKDAFPPSPTPNVKTNDVCYLLVENNPKNMGYIDLTGRFPSKSAKGNQYIIVAYHYDANAIYAHPIKNRESSTITTAWSTINTKFTIAGVKPNTYIIDNEASLQLKTAMKTEKISHQLVPPHNHRANLAERAIQTFKNHFKAAMATADPDFPLAQWDLLLEQVNITLNLLRASRSNPKLSAYAYLFGNLDFQATPLAPPGTRVVAFKPTNTRTTWGANGEDGWYVGPALEHYRCVSVFFPLTRSVRQVDTVRYFPHTIPFPKVSLEDHLRQAGSDIVRILSHPPSTLTPDLESGDSISNAILKLGKILNTADKIPKLKQRIDSVPLPRVKETTWPGSVTPPRVNKPELSRTPPQASSLKKLKNKQIMQNLLDRLPKQNWQKNNIGSNDYNLRSKTRSQSFKSTAAKYLLAQHIFSSPSSMHIYDETGKKMSIDKLVNGTDKHIWIKSLSMELGRLAQGNIHGVTSTDTIDFILKQDVPLNEKVTYASCVCDHRPLKPEKYRVRIVVGGDRLDCDIDSGAPATNLAEFKLLINSVISDAKNGAQFLSCDLKDFFLASPMKKPRYMKMKASIFPPDIIDQYNLNHKIAKDGYIYIKIKKGMYGLKEAAVLAYNQFSDFLNRYGYSHVPGTAGVWKHATKRTAFCLCVDDIALKYYNKEDLAHFLTALKNHYDYHMDHEGMNYIGLTLDWNYQQGYVDISMPTYIPKLLAKLNHPRPKKPQYSPHEHYLVKYTKKGERQLTRATDTTPLLDKKETTRIQSIVGALLYYGRSIDNTILPALNDIAMFQSKPTEHIRDKCTRLLDYVSTFPNVTLRYHASNMHLHVDSDAAYLVAPKARSRIAGFYYFKKDTDGNTIFAPNHPILVECRCLRHVVSSAAEAETAGVFHNAQISIQLRRILHAFGHPQPATAIKTDNATAHGFVHNNMHLRKSKTWDMRYYWLRDRETQKQIKVYWKRGLDENDPNLGDYHTKHHSTIHHKGVRPLYVRDHLINNISTLQQASSVLRGCIIPVRDPYTD